MGSQQRGREKFIREFFDNPIYFLFRKAVLKEQLELPHSKPELQKICLYAAVLSGLPKKMIISIWWRENLSSKPLRIMPCWQMKVHRILKIASNLHVSNYNSASFSVAMPRPKKNEIKFSHLIQIEDSWTERYRLENVNI